MLSSLDMQVIWNHASELETDLLDMNDAELLECRGAMLSRAQSIMALLHDLVPEDMSEFNGA